MASIRSATSRCYVRFNRGGLGARSLNIDLQQALNPPSELRVDRFGWIYGIGDKVTQVENDHDKEVYNGDLGVVRSIARRLGDVKISPNQVDIWAFRLGEIEKAAAFRPAAVQSTSCRISGGRGHDRHHRHRTRSSADS
jgi:hypothetical protein